MTTISSEASKQSPSSLRTRIWDWLIKPSSLVVDPDKRRLAQLMAGLTLASFLLIGIRLLIGLQSGSYQTDNAFVLYYVFFALLVASYVASRTQFLNLSLLLFVFGYTGLVYGIVFFRNASDPLANVNSLIWVLPGYFFGAVLFPYWISFLWMLANLAALGFLPRFVPAVDGSVVNGLLFTLLVLTVLNMVLNRYRALVENDRQSKILDTNRQLQALNSTLEGRVAERTHALETRTRALEVSADVSRRLSTILDPDQLVLEVVEQVQTAYNYYHAHIYLLEADGSTLKMVGGTGAAGKTMLERGHAIPVGRGVVGQAAQLKQGILVPDTTKEPNWLLNPLLPDTKAEVAVPILLGDQVIGVLDVQDDATDDVFPEDVELLQAIANQVAIALQNARQYAEAHRLFEGGQALAAANDYQSMLDAFITYGTPQAERGALLVFNTEHGRPLTVEYAAAFPYAAEFTQPIPLGSRFTPDEIPFLSQLRNNEILAIADVNHQAVIPEMADLMFQFGAQAMVGLPLSLAGEQVGALLFGYTQPRAVNEQALQSAQTMANQMAILLQNQRLLAETQDALHRLDIVNRRLTGQGWQEYAQATGPLLAEDVSTTLAGATDLHERAFEHTLAVPLHVRGTEIGQFTVQRGEGDETFTQADHDLLQEVALEVALTLENMRLVEQTQRNAAALEASRNLLDSIIENLPVLLFVKDAKELRYVTWNKAGEEILGIAAADVLGKNAYDSFTKEEADRFTAQDREVLSGTNFLDITEETVVTPRGLRILHTRKTPVYGPDGQPQYLIGLSEDITEQKEAEQQFRKFQLALERSTDAVFMTDDDGIIEYINPAFERTYGYTKEESIGQTPRIIKSGLIPQDQYTQFWGTLLKDEIIAGEIINRRKDGRLIPIEAMNASILDANGNRLGFMATHRDITERKRVQELLTKRATELETVTNIANTIATIQNPQEMLQSVVDLTKANFDLYHAHIYLLDDAGQALFLTAGADQAGQIMVAEQHTIALDREQSLVARAARTRQGVIVNDVITAPDFLSNPLLPDTRSELAVPLIVGDSVLGVLDVQSAQVDHFQPEDLRIMSILAAQIAVALDNARANEQTSRTLRELDALTRRLTHEGWQTYLTDTSHERLAYLFESNKLVQLEGNGALLPSQTAQSYIQPVMVHGEQIGQVIAEDITVVEDEFQAILEAVSAGLSNHLDNLRLNEQTERALAEARQRSAELNVLNEMGNSFTKASTVDELVHDLCAFLPQLIPANDFYIALNYPERNEVEIRVFIGGEPYSHFTRAQGNGITEYILRTRQPIFVQGNLPEIAAERGFEVIGRITQAFMGVPMNAGQDTLGVIAVQNEHDPHRFNSRHLDLLTTVAGQTAIAMSNIYLLTQTQLRAEELSVINRVVSSVAASLDIRESLQAVADELAYAARVDQVGIALFNEEKTELTVVAEVFDPAISVTAIGFVIPVEGNPSTQEVLRTRRPLVVTDPLTSPLTAPFHEGLRLRGVQTLTIFPILVGEDVVGTVGIDVLETGRMLTLDQMRLIETIVYQASIAINNVQLFEQTQQALQEVQALYDVSVQLNAARTMPELLLALTEPAVDAGAFSTAMLTFELDAAAQPVWGVLVAESQTGDEQSFPIGTRFRLAEYPSAHLWLNSPDKTIFIEDLYTNDQIDEATRAIYRQMKTTSVIWIPLVSQNRWLGLVNISWAEPHRFTATERRLYEALRTQGSTILENRVLYENSQARAAELGVINQVAETVSRQLDPEQVMESVYHQVQRIMVADAFLIGLYDPDKDEVVYPILYDNGQRFEQAPKPRDSQSYVFQVIDTGKPIFINSVTQQDVETEKPRVGDAAAYPDSLIYVPLFSGMRVTGAMSVQSYSPNAYDEGDVTLLAGIASHVALALQNARLFAQTQERATELATINEMSRIASSQLSLAALVEAVGRQLERTFASTGVYVALYHPERQQISFPYFLETDDGERQLIQVAPRHLDDPGITSRIIQTRQPVLVTEDTYQQMITLGAATTDSDPTQVESYLGVPMIVGDEVVGVIAVQNDVGHKRFVEADQKLLMTLASTIAVAVQNARQFEVTQRRAQRERLLNEITQKIQGSHTVEGALQTAVKELGVALKAKYTRVEIAAATEPPTNGKNGG